MPAGQAPLLTLIARHGQHWSDGVSLHVHKPSAGFHAGVQQAQMLMLLMANEGPKLLLEGANKADADAAAKKIEEAGGKVELK